MNIVEARSIVDGDREAFHLVFDDKRTMVLISAFDNSWSHLAQPRFQRFAIFEACSTYGIQGNNDSEFFRRLKSTFQTVAITRAGFARFYDNDFTLLKLMASAQ